MSHKTIIRLSGVARNPANGFPASLLDRYRVTTDKASGIVNDPNDWGAEIGNPRYIIDLVKRVATVSVETVAIVKALPPLEEGA